MNERTKRLWKRILVGELSVKRLVLAALFIYCSLLAFALLGADQILFQPHPPGYTRDEGLLFLETEGGARIAARHFTAPGARYTILFSHGNAEDLGDIEPLLLRLQALGLDVIAYDYEGYGQSEGRPSEARVYADIDAVYRYLTEQRGVPSERILAYGRSLGGGPSVDLASREPLGGPSWRALSPRRSA
jgi:hypothetical protein